MSDHPTIKPDTEITEQPTGRLRFRLSWVDARSDGVPARILQQQWAIHDHIEGRFYSEWRDVPVDKEA